MIHLGRTQLLAVVLVLSGVAAAQAGELIRNSNFDSGTDGWTNQAAAVENVVSDRSPAGGRGGGGALHIRSTNEGSGTPLIWRYRIDQPPPGRRIRFSGWVRGKGCTSGPIICAQAWGQSRDKIIGFATTQQTYQLTGDFVWTRIEATIIPPRETVSIHILAFLVGAGEVWFDDLSAEPGSAVTEEDLATGRVGRPGLFVARGEYAIESTAGGLSGFVRSLFSTSQRAQGPRPLPKLLLPVPLSYREQVPLTYELRVEPKDKLMSARIYEDRPGNFVTEVELCPLTGVDRVELRWFALVVIGPRSFDDVPAAAPLPERWPAQVRQWLRATRAAQADNQRIQSIAREIRGDSRDVLEIIRATLKRMKGIFAAQRGYCTELDAVQALDREGSCTSCANLAAALLRANGIPTRILAGYPCPSVLQTHYTVEAWVPHYGWYPIESTTLEAPLSPIRQIQVAIIPPEYEDRSQQRRGIMGGVPYLSLTEYVDDDGLFTTWGIADASRNCDHAAAMRQAFPADTTPEDWTKLLAAARRRWSAWLASEPQATGGGLLTPLTADSFDGAETAADVLQQLGE